MPDINTNGLLPVSTNNTTWVAPTENFPVTLANQQRGGVMVITGQPGDQLLNINGRLLQDGSIVFNQTQYTEAAGIVRAANTYFRYVSGAARDAQGLVPNASANWQALDTGGGGTGTFTPLADIAALDTEATAPPADEAEFTVLDPTGAQNANPAIANLQNPVGGWSAELNLNVQWRAATQDWLSLGFTVDNPDARYVNTVGDTMTGTLTIDNTTPNQDALVTGQGNDIALGVDSNIVFEGGTADDNETTLTVAGPTADRTITLPDATGNVTLDPATPAQTTSYVRQVTDAGVATWEADSGAGVWTRTGTNLSPTTAGDDVLLNVNETLSLTGTDNTNPDPVERTITFQAPTNSATFTADYTLTLPSTDGEPNQVLQTDGAGVLDWAAVSGGVAVEDSGTSVVADASTLNFTGTGVTVTDAGNNQANIAITGGGSGPDDNPDWSAPSAAGQFAQNQCYFDHGLNFTRPPLPSWLKYGRGSANGMGDNTGTLQYGYSYVDGRGIHWAKSNCSYTTPTYYNAGVANYYAAQTPQSTMRFHQTQLYDGQMADLARRDPDNYGDWLLSAEDDSVLDPAPGRGYNCPRIRHYLENTQNTICITREGYAYVYSGYNGLGNCVDGTTTSPQVSWRMVAFYAADGTTLLTGPNKPRIRQVASTDCGGATGAAGYSVYFVSSDGRLWAGGYDYYGQLGTPVGGNVQPFAKEFPLSLFGNQQVSNVFASPGPGVYVLTVDGKCWYMGQNQYGEANNGQASAANPADFVTVPFDITSNANSSLHNKKVVSVLCHGVGVGTGGTHVLDSEGVVHFMGYSEYYGQMEGVRNGGDPAQGTLEYATIITNSVLMENAANTMNSDNQKVISMWGSVYYGGRYFITDGGDSGEPKVYTCGYLYNGCVPGEGKNMVSTASVAGDPSNEPIYANEVVFCAFGYMPGSAAGYQNPVVGTQWSPEVRSRMDIGRIVKVMNGSDGGSYGQITWFIDEYGRGYFCGYWPTTLTTSSANIQYCPDGQDVYMNGMAGLPAECGYDGYVPPTLYSQSNYSFAVLPLVNQPEPFTDIRIGMAATGATWANYQYWHAIGKSGTLWGGNGECIYWNQSYQYGFGENEITAVPPSVDQYGFGGWQILNLENT